MKNYLLFILVIFLFQCGKENKAPLSGAELAKQYCSTCHLYPQPEILNQPTWQNHVLPRMGAFMGIYESGYERSTLIEEGQAQAIIEQANIFPTKAQLSTAEWSAIKDFYLGAAPQILPSSPNKDTLSSTPLFKAVYPELFLSPPSTTYVTITNNNIAFADANKAVFVNMDKNFNITNQAKVGEGLTHIQETNNALWLTVMGSFSPTDASQGYILRLDKQSAGAAKKIIPTLQRPVHSSYADINNDGLEDIIVSEYGKWTGGISLHLQQKDGTYQSQRLINRAGAIKTALIDLNNDKQLDILALFGQGDEGFVLLENQGGASFQAKPLLRLHPSMGSSSFRLWDWNQDGKQDILYTAGDNADYPPVIKPYHGIYVFEQGNNMQFQQKLFLPMPGAYGAIPSDFDQDGDEDITAISFFPDYNSRHPHEFCLFEKEGEKFTQKIIDLNQQGRWLTFDKGDYDGDGDEDLILGSLTFEAPGHKQLIDNWVQNGLPFLILENTVKK